jgi:CHASE3 domain sensor protein
MPVSSPKHTRQHLGILFSLPLFFCLVFFLMQVAAEDTDTHLLQIQNLESDVNRLDSLAKNAESSERGFLLTGDLTLLTPFQAAKLELNHFQVDQKGLGKLRPLMDSLVQLVQVRISQTDHVLAAQKNKGFAAAISQTKIEGSESTMNSLQSASDELRKQLSDLETQYLKHQHTLNNTAILFFAIGTIAMIGVMYWLYNEVLS